MTVPIFAGEAASLPPGVTRDNPLPFEQFQYPHGDDVSAM
jgi:hypothetical protein